MKYVVNVVRRHADMNISEKWEKQKRYREQRQQWFGVSTLYMIKTERKLYTIIITASSTIEKDTIAVFRLESVIKDVNKSANR